MNLDEDPATIEQFGDQFTRFSHTHERGFYGASEHLIDTFGPLMPQLQDTIVAEIGAGPGRVVRNFLDLGVRHVTALEPSSAHTLIPKDDRVTVVNAPGNELPLAGFDFVFSIGVIHHIRNPRPVIERAYAALKPGGKLLVWLYAVEGNRVYLSFVRPLRVITTRMPDGLLAALANLLNAALFPYLVLARFLPVPRHRHFRQVFGKMTWAQRTLVIFDQLNPSDAKYYTRAEAKGLLEQCGFTEVQLYHRHGYSWAVAGMRPKNSQ